MTSLKNLVARVFAGVNPSVMVLAVLMLLLIPTLALAADPTDVGVNMSDWLIRNISGLFTVALVIGAIVFLVKREVMGFIGFLALAAVVAFLVFAPASFKCFAIGLGNKILGTTAGCS